MIKSVNYLQECGDAPLGYGFTVEICSHCGYQQLSIHPIPMKHPSECNKCGRKACYVDEDFENEFKSKEM